MKIFNEAKVEIKEQGYDVIDHWQNDCTHVIYDTDFHELLQQWTPDKQASTFISKKKYPTDLILKHDTEEPSSLSEVTFQNENVTQVSDRIRTELQQLVLDKTFGDIQKYILLIATELVQNALIYGRIRNLHHLVTLSLGVYNDKVQITVTDNYGALELAQILSKLKRFVIDGTYEQKKEGAGLGLFMVTRSCDKMIVKVKADKQTRICCEINRYQRLKEYKSKNISFYYIKEEER